MQEDLEFKTGVHRKSVSSEQILYISQRTLAESVLQLQRMGGMGLGFLPRRKLPLVLMQIDREVRCNFHVYFLFFLRFFLYILI